MEAGPVILGGDFNAQWEPTGPLGCLHGRGHTCLRRHADPFINGHGRLLIKACEDSAMVLCTGSTPSNIPATVSYMSYAETGTSRVDHLNLPFTMEEVEAGLRRLNNGRSGALLGYTSELLRYGKHPRLKEVPVLEHLLAPCITAFFNTAFSTGTTPDAWRTSLVTPIHRRGDATEPSNYRPIAVGTSVQALHQHSQSAPGQPH